jgi:hypothetical protein
MGLNIGKNGSRQGKVWLKCKFLVLKISDVESCNIEREVRDGRNSKFQEAWHAGTEACILAH